MSTLESTATIEKPLYISIKDVQKDYLPIYHIFLERKVITPVNLLSILPSSLFSLKTLHSYPYKNVDVGIYLNLS